MRINKQVIITTVAGLTLTTAITTGAFSGLKTINILNSLLDDTVGMVEVFKNDKDGKITELNNSITVLTNEKIDLQTQVSQWEADYNSKVVELETANNEIERLEGELETANQNLTKAQADISTKEGTIQTLTNEKNTIQSQLNSMTTERDNLQNSIDAMLAEAKMAGYETIELYIEGLKNTINTKETEIEELETEVTRLTNELSTAEAERDRLNGLIDQATGKALEARNEVAVLTENEVISEANIIESENGEVTIMTNWETKYANAIDVSNERNGIRLENGKCFKVVSPEKKTNLFIIVEGGYAKVYNFDTKELLASEYYASKEINKDGIVYGSTYYVQFRNF